jgi:hypothetical protein
MVPPKTRQKTEIFSSSLAGAAGGEAADRMVSASTGVAVSGV